MEWEVGELGFWDKDIKLNSGLNGVWDVIGGLELCFPERNWSAAMKFYRAQRRLTRQVTLDSERRDWAAHPGSPEILQQSLRISAWSSSWRHSRSCSTCAVSIPSYSKSSEPNRHAISFPLLVTTGGAGPTATKRSQMGVLGKALGVE